MTKLTAPYPRERIDDLSTRLPQNSSLWYTVPPSRPASPAKALGPLIGSYRVMNDIVTPGFKELASRGLIINTPMGSTTLDIKQTDVVGPHFKNVGPSSTSWGEIEGIAVSGQPVALSTAMLFCHAQAERGGLAPDISLMRAIASTQARANIAEPDFEGLVSLGELKETLRYLRNPFSTGLKLASILERNLAMAGTASRRGRLSQQVANLYTEFRYGVRPLIREVEGLLDAAKKQEVPRPLRKTARAYQLYEKSFAETQSTSYAGILHDIHWSMKRKTLIRAGFLYDFTMDDGLNDRWGMRLSDVPSAAWAVMPLSFVYDWFANMGDYIAAITPRAGTRTLSQWTTFDDTISIEARASNYSMGIAGWTTARAGTSKMAWTLRTRSRVPSVQGPSVELRDLDTLKNDALRLLDLIGITHQKLSNSARSSVVKRANQDQVEKFGKRIDRRLNDFESSQNTRFRNVELQRFLKSLGRKL